MRGKRATKQDFINSIKSIVKFKIIKKFPSPLLRCLKKPQEYAGKNRSFHYYCFFIF